MKAIFFGLLAAPLVFGHHAITNLYVNGKDQGQITCLRHASTGAKWSSPVEDLTSSDMACGLQGTTPVARACPVPDGATLTFRYRETPNNPSSTGTLDPTHKGPCAIYLKKVDDATYDGAAGGGWFKLWDFGNDGQWCNEKLIDNGGYLSATLPLGLAGGYYLVRTEQLALHNNNDQKLDPQYYISCAQIYLQSSGTLTPASTVSIPGYASYADEADSAVLYDAAFNPQAYIPPGPAPASLVQGGSPNTSPMPNGAKPSTCILQVGNWCASEVPSFSSSQACWSAVSTCWSTNSACWASSDLWVTQACYAWQSKCTALAALCYNPAASGPPNMGVDVSSQTTDISPPPPPGPTRMSSAKAGNAKRDLVKGVGMGKARWVGARL